MAYLKRVFLNPIKDGAPSFIQAVAEDSDEGTYLLGNYLLIIADCHRRITLEFALSSKKARKQARAKVDRLAHVVNKFREQVIRELELIDNAERATVAATRKNRKSRRQTTHRS